MSTTLNQEPEMTIASYEDRDPISGALGAHPVGTGVGAALGGAAAGAAAATVVGRVGKLVGAAVAGPLGLAKVCGHCGRSYS